VDSLAPKGEQIRRTRLSSQSAFDAHLTYYPPHLHQPDQVQLHPVVVGSVDGDLLNKLREA
jgi:hypothetical protein